MSANKEKMVHAKMTALCIYIYEEKKMCQEHCNRESYRNDQIDSRKIIRFHDQRSTIHRPVMLRHAAEHQRRHIVRRAVKRDEWLSPLDLDFLRVRPATDPDDDPVGISRRNAPDGRGHRLEVAGAVFPHPDRPRAALGRHEGGVQRGFSRREGAHVLLEPSVQLRLVRGYLNCVVGDDVRDQNHDHEYPGGDMCCFSGHHYCLYFV